MKQKGGDLFEDRVGSVSHVKEAILPWKFLDGNICAVLDK